MIGFSGFFGLCVLTFTYMYPGVNSPIIGVKIVVFANLLAVVMRLLTATLSSAVVSLDIRLNLVLSSRIISSFCLFSFLVFIYYYKYIGFVE